MIHPISKERLYNLIKHHGEYLNDSVVCSFDFLKITFGFIRKPGLEILLTQVLLPSKTEMDIQMLPKIKIIEAVELWGKENGILVTYDGYKDVFHFRKININEQA